VSTGHGGSTAPVLDLCLGGPAGVGRDESLPAGVGYLLRRNVRLTGDVTRDLEQEITRWTFGVVTAF
jgi:hypothetical protein